MIHTATLSNAQTKALINALAVGREQVIPKYLAKHFVVWNARLTHGDSITDVKAR